MLTPLALWDCEVGAGVFGWRQDQLPAPLFQHPLHGRGEVQDEMESVGNLLRLWGSQRSALGVKTTAVPSDCHDFGMLLEPFGKTLGGPIR